MEIQPGREAIEDSVRFLKRRIHAEQSFSSGLTALLKKYAKKLIDIGFKYKVQPRDFQFSANAGLEKEVNRLMADLRDEIWFLLEYSVTLCGDTDDEKSELLYFLGLLGSKSQSAKQQVATYTNRFKFEVEAFIGAGLLANVMQGVVLSHYVSSMKSPWTDSLVRMAFKEKGVKAERLRNKGVSYGVGRSNVAFNLLNRLGIGSVAISAWEYESSKFSESGVVGYMQYRGSSYPCSICDAEARFHPVSDLALGYPHVHCRCYRVPVYKTDIDNFM